MITRLIKRFAPVAASGQREEVLDEALSFGRLVADLSPRFISLPPTDIDGAIDAALRHIVETLGIDRSTLTEFSSDLGYMRLTHSWAVDGMEPVATWISTTKVVPWALTRVKAGLPILFDRLDDLPLEASVDKVFWRQIGLKSHITVPLFVGGELAGALSMDCVRHERRWSQHDLGHAQVLAEIFGHALARDRAQKEVERALGFERLLADIFASLLKEPPGALDSAINAALRAIGEFLNVERVAFWTLNLHPPRLELEYRWVAEGAEAVPLTAGKGEFPWIVQRLVRGETVRFSKIGELPDEADVDKRALHALGKRALLMVPITVEEAVVAAISLAAASIERAWPDTLVPRVRLIGEMFAAMLARRRASVQMREALVEAGQHRERLAHLIRVHTVGDMSASIAHEIDQPLVAIGNYAQAARRRLAVGSAIDTDKLEKLLEKIGAQAARAGEVLQRLRSMLKKHEPRATQFDFGQLVSETVKLAEMGTHLQDVRVEVSMRPGLPPVIADEIQIHQVLLNLLRNALESMEDGAIAQRVLKIDVQCFRPSQLLVRVIDHGHGVAPGDGERVFEPFYSTKTSGLGMGLAICRAIVVAHGGQLWYSPNPDGGAMFEFTLPVATAGR